MGPGLGLFHCDTPGGNRAKEEQFQRFVVSKRTANGLELVSESQLERLLASARENPYDNQPFAALATLLETSLGSEAYEFFVDDVIGLPIAIACFFAEYAAAADSVDFRGTEALHYPKYRVYKFASFLDLLRPGRIRWRGDVELESDPFVCKALEQFRTVDTYGKTAILSRWMKLPDETAFSEKKANQSKELHKRRAFLQSLPARLAPPILAGRLDNRFPKKRGEKYPSYTAWLRENPNSFASWVSKERKVPLRLSKRILPKKGGRGSLRS